MRHHRRWGGCLAMTALGLLAGHARESCGASPPALVAPIVEDLKHFEQMGSILMVAAHPDDENTQLITYAARGPGYRMAYLSLTRGDGGQNLLGPEFGPILGVIRTQELLAARRLDGGQQFFTRAIDFGYSKDPQQTLKIWDRQAVLGDVVRVIRTFRPDVIVTVFSPTAGNTHGHHTASAILAQEAFKLAGDASSYPEQLSGKGALAAWQPKRIMMNVRGGGGGAGAAGTVRMDIGGMDPVLGEGFGDIAQRSRAMHKTQGFGQQPGGPARGGGGGPNTQGFALLAGEPMATGIFDGVDTTWGRVTGGADIGKMTEDVIAKFDVNDPAASAPELLAIRKVLLALPADPVVEEKKRQFDRILQSCLGLTVETTIANAEVVPGEAMHLKTTVLKTSKIPVQWLGTGHVADSGAPHANPEKTADLASNQAVSKEQTLTMPAGTPVSQPYWLQKEPTPGMFTVDDPTLIGRPENPPTFALENIFVVGGQTLRIVDEPVQVITTAGKPDVRRRLDVIAPVSLHFKDEVRLFPADARRREVMVEVTAHRANAAGIVRLDVPAGWKVADDPREEEDQRPPGLPFKLSAVGDHVALAFTVTAPQGSAAASIGAHAEMDGARFYTDRQEIHYDHIPPLLLQPPALCKAVSLDLAIKGKQVGYLAGAGDSVAESLEQMGYAVTQITGADLTADKLKKFDAVVVGIRAFNTRTDLAANVQGLFDYADAGGTVIEQYNTPNGLKTPKLAPFNLALSNDLPRNRVTDPSAPVTLLAPEDPAFTTPNKITPADFDGWVQERGLNFPSTWDDAHFTALLAASDINEPPLKSGLLVARTGKGYFVYTGLSWFRQLPAGVPGAYRLFANLVSLGK